MNDNSGVPLDFSEPTAREDNEPEGSRFWHPEIQMLVNVEAKAVPWLWEPYIPLGMLTMLTGDPGVGKSYVALAIAADVTRQGGTVIYLTIENSPEYTLRPRFDALKGDPAKFALLEGAQAKEQGQEIRRLVTLTDLDIIGRTVEQLQARLIVIDPSSPISGLQSMLTVPMKRVQSWTD